ncbi:MAG: hypothetical protein AAF290_15170 [Pseudomonadota bacterium]
MSELSPEQFVAESVSSAELTELLEPAALDWVLIAFGGLAVLTGLALTVVMVRFARKTSFNGRWLMAIGAVLMVLLSLAEWIVADGDFEYRYGYETFAYTTIAYCVFLLLVFAGLIRALSHAMRAGRAQ